MSRIRARDALSVAVQASGEAFDSGMQVLADQTALQVAKIREANDYQYVSDVLSKKIGDFSLAYAQDPENFDYIGNLSALENEATNFMNGYTSYLDPKRAKLLKSGLNENLLKLKLKGIQIERDKEEGRATERADSAMLSYFNALDEGNAGDIEASKSKLDEILELNRNSGAFSSKKVLDYRAKEERYHDSYTRKNVLNMVLSTELDEGPEKAVEKLESLRESKTFKNQDIDFQNKVMIELKRLKKEVNKLDSSSGKLAPSTKQALDNYENLRDSSIKTGQVSNEMVQKSAISALQRLQIQYVKTKGNKQKKFFKDKIEQIQDRFLLDRVIKALPNALRKEETDEFLKHAKTFSKDIYGKEIDFGKKDSLTDEGRRLIAERNDLVDRFNGFKTPADVEKFFTMRKAYEDIGTYKELEKVTIQKVDDFVNTLPESSKAWFNTRMDRYGTTLQDKLSEVLTDIDQVSNFLGIGGVTKGTTSKQRGELSSIIDNTFLDNGDTEGFNRMANFLTSMRIDVGEILNEGIKRTGIRDYRKSLSILSDGGYGTSAVYATKMLGVLKNVGSPEAVTANSLISKLRPKILYWYRDNRGDLKHLGSQDEVVDAMTLSVAGALEADQKGTLASTPEITFFDIMRNNESEEVAKVIEELQTKHPGITDKVSLDGNDPLATAYQKDREHLIFEYSMGSILDRGNFYDFEGKRVSVRSNDVLSFLLATLDNHLQRVSGGTADLVLGQGVLQDNLRMKGTSEGYKFEYRDVKGSWHYITVGNGEDFVISKKQASLFNSSQPMSRYEETSRIHRTFKYSDFDEVTYNFNFDKEKTRPIFRVFQGNMSNEEFRRTLQNRNNTRYKTISNRFNRWTFRK